jgi:hypothetical protein
VLRLQSDRSLPKNQKLFWNEERLNAEKKKLLYKKKKLLSYNESLDATQSKLL